MELLFFLWGEIDYKSYLGKVVARIFVIFSEFSLDSLEFRAIHSSKTIFQRPIFCKINDLCYVVLFDCVAFLLPDHAILVL